MSDQTRDHYSTLLRRAGLVALVMGPLIILVGIGGASLLESKNDGSTYSSTTGAYAFVAGVGILGILELLAGVAALMGASGTLTAARLTWFGDFVWFTAVVMSFGFVVTLIVLGEALVALVVVLVMALVLYTITALRKGLSTVKRTGAATAA